MALIAKLYILIFFVSVGPIYSQGLPEVSTKQSMDNLRFVSRDGDFTYYQRRNGSLLISKNFEVVEVIKGERGTHYQLTSSSSRERILVTQDLNYYDHLNLRKNKKIYSLSYGGDSPSYIGEGSKAKLHLNDTWLSYYQYNSKELTFHNLQSDALNFKIELKNIKNPFFAPQVIMLNTDRVLYTDLNELGIPGLLLYDRKSKEIDIFERGDAADQKIELCYAHNRVFIMSTGINDSRAGTEIISYPKDKLKAPNREVHYRSEQNDLGQMQCSEDFKKIFFIKNTASTQGQVTHELAEILWEQDNKLNVLTSLNYVTQMINLDGRIIVPFRGKYFMAHGDQALTQNDKLSPISVPDEIGSEDD